MDTIELTTLQTEAPTTGSVSTWRDWFGIVASIGCAIHCAAMPFVIAYLPALGLSFLADEAFHKWMALVCFLIAIAAFVPGIRKHRKWTPLAVGTVGLILITFAAFGLAGECCASCNAAAPVAATSEASQVDPAAGCASCESCAQCQATAESEATDIFGDSISASKETNLLKTLTPWITPIGGVILVCAHLMNKRYGCRCGCCETN